MNQSLLGALRAAGSIIIFAALTAVIGAIPDALTHLPVIGPLVTPGISAVITAALLAYEHSLADHVGYNLPAGSIKVDKD